jgi:D-alanine-D-alanine ligase
MQRLLEADGRPYVGTGPVGARRAMDKALTKSVAAGLGLTVSPTAVFDRGDPACPLDLPVVVKPVFEGSTIGLHVCRTEAAWRAAHAATSASGRAAMVEPFVAGRELTVGLVDLGRGLEALPAIEIVPAEGLYDYRAKYERDDTRYVVDPALPEGVGERIRAETLALAGALGLRDLCRADFLLDDKHRAWLLEVNTMPGFTSHSLVPMAAAARGIPMPALCEALVERALSRREGAASGGRTNQGRHEEGSGAG